MRIPLPLLGGIPFLGTIAREPSLALVFLASGPSLALAKKAKQDKKNKKAANEPKITANKDWERQGASAPDDGDDLLRKYLQRFPHNC